MAILNFPVNPIHEQSYSANGVDYTWDSDTSSWLSGGVAGYTGSQGYTGSKGSGYTGSRGDLGFTGSAGDLGYTGSEGTGYTGSSAAQGLKYRFDTTTGSLTSTASGHIRFDASPGSATKLAFHKTGYDGNPHNGFLQTWDDFGNSLIGYGYIHIRSADTSSSDFLLFAMDSDATTTTDHVTVGVNPLAGSASFSNDEDIIIQFNHLAEGIQGPIGFTGSQGDIGFTGSRGDTGFTGSQGDIGYTGSQGNNGADGSSVTVLGSVATVGNLPSVGNTVADAYVVQADGHLYVWDGSAWQDAGEFRGYTGSRGNIGFTGSRGDTGFTGSQGDIGYTGSRGDTGFTGSRSTAIGYTGSKGDIGYTGSAGTNGYTGSPGTNGYTGSAGQVDPGQAVLFALVWGG